MESIVVLDILEALLKLGLPMVLMSWWVYSWLYRTGRLDPQGSRKEHENQLKLMRKQQKKERAAGRKAKLDGKQNTDPEDFWLQKWMWFGGGFYGMAALWTLLVVEALVGHDGLNQFKMFQSALRQKGRGIDGLILTKFDTVSDKVGAALTLTRQTGVPIVFTGTGQKYHHLQKLSVASVVSSLFS